MYSLIIFYVLSSQFHTDLSSLTVGNFQNEQLCEQAATKVMGQLYSAYEPKRSSWICVRQGAGN